ncbi:MAG: OmpA family protein [Pseudomonadota bacterium]
MRSAWRLSSRLVLILSVVTLFSNFYLKKAYGDDCRRVLNILILFDASGFMKEKDHYEVLLKQMQYFEKAIPLTADGFFNVGLRHYGLKVGMGCESTESILAIQPWDPERFMNSFPRSVSYGTSALAAGLRGAGDDVAAADGKSIIAVIGGGLESCKSDPIKITEQIVRNNPDVEIHTFQIGNAQDGAYFMKGIAQKGKGAFHNVAEFNSPAGWHEWMLKYWVKPCRDTRTTSGTAGTTSGFGPILFDFNSSSVISKDPATDNSNRVAIAAAAMALKQNPTSKIILRGFSDARGKPEQNLAVARKRAEAVAQFLSSMYGVPRSRINVQVASPSAPAPLSSRDDRTSRRVEMELSR